jgi:alpha-mannosidase
MGLKTHFTLALSALLLGAAQIQAVEPPSAGKDTFWVIPHTHWEGAVFKTREEYLEMGLPNILKAMRLLKEQPEFRFVLDQVAYVKPFLERYPDQEADLRRFLAEGRLQLVGGLDVMPDVNMPGGETFIRQMQYGKRYYREQLGVDVTTGWLLDTFGHHAQIPQLLALGGYKSFWCQRGVNRPDHPSEFLWEGIDGTRIPAFWLPHSYGLLFGAPHDPAGFETFVKQRFAILTPNSHGKDRVGLAGADVSEPDEQLVPMIKAFNSKGDAPFVMRMTIPSEFEALIAQRKNLPVFRGELNPIFQGTYSSRIELKAWMRIMEQKLLTAEKLGALAQSLGIPFDQSALWRAWEPVLFNQTHDLASGVMTDHVYEDTIRSYEFSNRLADELINAGWKVLTSRIDTRGEGSPVVVFNSLGWNRTDLAVVDLGFTQAHVRGVSLLDELDKEVPLQLERSTNYADGALKTARVAFVARDVPALGYRVYHAVGRDRDIASSHPQLSQGDAMETSRYRISHDLSTGAIKSLRLKPDDWEVFAGPANVVARHEDRGDLWEPYRGLDGGSKIAMTTRQDIPEHGKARFSHEFRGQPGTIRSGPVFSEFQVAHALDSGRYAAVVRLYADLPRIECQLELVNNEKYVRYHALFPTSIKGGRSVHEIPFGAIERPEGIEFPAQNWVDYGNSQRGLALLNAGTPGNVQTDGTMMLSVLRAHTLGAYGFGGGYEPGMSSDSGFQLGKVRTMRYALFPHAGSWKEAGVFRQGLEFNHPLIARPVVPHNGVLPPRLGFLEISAPNVVVSDLKPAREGALALRVYEATGKSTPGVTIRPRSRVAAAREANLLEDPGRPLSVAENAVWFDLHPYEIKTVVFQLEPAGSQ